VRELRDDRAVLGKRCARLAGTAEEADETQDRAAGVLGEPLLVRQVLDGLENGLGRASQFVERLCAGGGGRGQAHGHGGDGTDAEGPERGPERVADHWRVHSSDEAGGSGGDGPSGRPLDNLTMSRGADTWDSLA